MVFNLLLALTVTLLVGAASSARADPYVVIDSKGVIQKIIEATDKSTCDASPGCTLTPLAQSAVAAAGLYEGPQPGHPDYLMCEPRSVKFDGTNLLLCTPDGKNVITAAPAVTVDAKPAN